MSIDGFDASKFMLGTLCKYGHEWGNTGKSLRYLKATHNCLECNKIANKQRFLKETAQRHEGVKYLPSCNCAKCMTARRQERAELARQLPPFNTDLMQLGRLCDRNHDYHGSGKSLRYIKDRGCVECGKQKQREDKERFRAYARTSYYRHYERNILRGKRYRDANREKLRARDRMRWILNPEKESARHKLYLRSEQGKRNNARKKFARRAKIKKAHKAPYSNQELRDRLTLFDSACAYCGSHDRITIDHFIPISKGGPDCLSNLLPCCQPCNSRKLNQDPEKWFKAQSFYSQKRWRQILKAVGTSQVGQLPLF